jgi:hypothetical protein
VHSRAGCSESRGVRCSTAAQARRARRPRDVDTTPLRREARRAPRSAASRSRSVPRGSSVLVRNRRRKVQAKPERSPRPASRRALLDCAARNGSLPTSKYSTLRHLADRHVRTSQSCRARRSSDTASRLHVEPRIQRGVLLTRSRRFVPAWHCCPVLRCRRVPSYLPRLIVLASRESRSPNARSTGTTSS